MRARTIGSNLICTSIHRALNRLFEEHVRDGEQPFIEQLTLQVDNCTGENVVPTVLNSLSLLTRTMTTRAMIKKCTNIIERRVTQRYALGGV